MLTWVPEGCMLMGVTNTVNETVYRYVDPEGNNLFFSYIHNMENGSATSWLDAGTEQLQTVTVNGRTADLFIDADNHAALVWLSEDEGTLFRLQSYCSVDDMIEMAKSVKKAEKM